MKHQAKKRFGQNFLIDQSIIQQLIDAIHPQADELVVEIGPGLGALTKPLLTKLNHLHLIEIDRDIIEWMQREYPAEKITIHASDVLKFDFASLKQDSQKLRIVGNLPYNISSPILFHLLPHLAHIQDMHFMLQKEVVERMVATPSSSEYGRLSVMLQYALQMENLITVPGEAFDPAPKVESAFVRCIPYLEIPHVAKDLKKFSSVVTAAFSQRRKTIRNTLKGFLHDEDYQVLNIDAQLRAENLSVADFVQISNYLD